MSSDKELIFFHYTYSPFARRVVMYLNLRKIPYSQCMQPITLPRPDINALGIQYRRIPLMSIGKDIYCDTRLILQKLEQLYPPSSAHPGISGTTTEHKAIQALLSRWVVDGPIFMRASQLIPTSMPTLKDPNFVKDREQLTGRSWDMKNVERMRPEAESEIKGVFTLLEEVIFADGREWVLGTKDISLADLEAAWPLIWVQGMKGALPPHVASEELFPKTWAWLARFAATTRAAAKNQPKPKNLSGEEALKAIAAAKWSDDVEGVQSGDPSGLKQGQVIQIWPTDSGFKNRDQGKLVGLTTKEIVWETKTKEGNVVRVHAPRSGFRIMAVKDGAKL